MKEQYKQQMKLVYFHWDISSWIVNRLADSVSGNVPEVEQKGDAKNTSDDLWNRWMMLLQYSGHEDSRQELCLSSLFSLIKDIIRVDSL